MQRDKKQQQQQHVFMEAKCLKGHSRSCVGHGGKCQQLRILARGDSSLPSTAVRRTSSEKTDGIAKVEENKKAV